MGQYVWSRPDRYFLGLCTNTLLPETSAPFGCQACVTPVDPPPVVPPGSVPTSVGCGAVSSGTGDITPALPSYQADDIFLLFVESDNETVSTPSGWTLIASTGVGTAGTFASTKLSVFWRRATASESAPTVTDPGDHVMARICSYRGCITTVSPIDAYVTKTVASAGSSETITALTTAADNRRIIAVMATSSTLGPTIGWTMTNSNLASFTQKLNNIHSSGNDGGMLMYEGEKATAGSIGLTTVTTPNTEGLSMIHIALRPTGS